jgi:hypothetical protein
MAAALAKEMVAISGGTIFRLTPRVLSREELTDGV